MKAIRLGVVGLGGRGRAMFALACENFPGVVAAAVCDLNEALWAQEVAGEPPFCQRFPDAVFYRDFDAMLREAKLDALLVETPAPVHAQFCAAGLEHGLHVMSDIPLVRSYEEAEMLWAAGRRSRAVFITGANPNEWGFVETLVDSHRRGLLGNVVYLEAEYLHDVRSLWAATPWRQTMMPITYCTHSLGPLLRVLDEDLRTVSCLDTGAKVVGGEDQHDLMTAHFQTPGGTICRFTASFINAYKGGCHSYRVFGTKGCFERLSERGEFPGRTLLNTSEIPGMSRPVNLPVGLERDDLPEAAGSGHGGADYALFKRFFAAIREGNPAAAIALREGLRMSLPGIFAAESARCGGEVLAIRYPWDEDESK